MKLRCYDIEWDTDDDEVDLPDEVVIEVDDDHDIMGSTDDVLSDHYGWLVDNFCVDIIHETPLQTLVEKIFEGESNA